MVGNTHQELPFETLVRQPDNSSDARTILEALHFADWQAAQQRIARLAGSPKTHAALTLILRHFLPVAGDTADPDGVLVNFDRFLRNSGDADTLLRQLAAFPRSVEQLARLFSGSQFLTEILLRDPNYFERLTRSQLLGQEKQAEDYRTEIEQRLSALEEGGALDAVRRFQRRELLRIGASDLLGYFDLQTVTAELSRLADCVLKQCLRIAAVQTGTTPDGFVVLAFGKLGGSELNYSSDIDLIFVAAEGANRFWPLAEKLIAALSRPSAEGFLYRVDMRLRPWGVTGPLVSTRTGYFDYMADHAQLWEKQALLKARPVAGDIAVGVAVLEQAASFIFQSSAATIRAEVYSMKTRMEMHLNQKGRDWGEVKLGVGSIRDVEFVTQYLQLAHGAKLPELRLRNTLQAMNMLARQDLLSPADHRILTDGYVFLRTLEHHLQLMHYRQTHTLPREHAALEHLARRLDFATTDALVDHFQQHSDALRGVYMRHLESAVSSPKSIGESPKAAVERHVARLVPSYLENFSADEIRTHAEMAARVNADNLVEVLAHPLSAGHWRLTIVGYDYFGELSVICGLLAISGLSIARGNVFTYEPMARDSPPGPGRRIVQKNGRERRKIVDVFDVRSIEPEIGQETWTRFAIDLAKLLQHLNAGEREITQGKLARRFAESVRDVEGSVAPLTPVDIDIDNDSSESYTVLWIEAPDTIGFLYEIATALAINRIYIARVDVDTTGQRVHDVLYVTDTSNRKITDADKLRELRAAIVLVKHFTHLLPNSPNPEAALLHFRSFLGQLFTRPDWPSELASLEQPEVLSALSRLLGVSDFLWEDFLRMQHDNLFPVIADVGTLAIAKDKSQLQNELSSLLLDNAESSADRYALNAFKDREMFRTDMRHIGGHVSDFDQFAAELSDLTEVVVAGALQLVTAELAERYGELQTQDTAACQYAVCALGKFGGRELGFASDIELMFIYSGQGQTTGPKVISAAQYYEHLVERFLATITTKRAGIFEVDIQLRPYGKAGALAVGLQAFQDYFKPGGPAWHYERQALIRLRPIAGDDELSRQVLDLRDRYVYIGQFDVKAMRAMRERQLRHMVIPGTPNPKFSPGGLVDVEYLVQGLQMIHGAADARMHSPNTKHALQELANAEVLSNDEYARLRHAHRFLRGLINALRIVRGNAKEMMVPPDGSDQLVFLARRLGYGREQGRLRQDMTRHMENVVGLSQRLLS